MISPVPFTHTPLPQNSDVLRVLPLSDLHLPRSTSHYIANNRPFLERADFVVFLGDMVKAYGTDREYNAVRSFVAEVRRPYTVVSGNHEWFFEEVDEDSGLYGELWDEGYPERQIEHIEKFKSFWQVDSLWRSYSSPLGHFIFLSLDDVGVSKQESISAVQFAFLEAELKRAGDKPVFIFCHCPLMLVDRLDMIYYDEDRTACIEPQGRIRQALLTREAPTFWMSGHIHLHPDHYLFPPYKIAANCYQIHCPDSFGYGRWSRDQRIPILYEAPFSRLLEIDTRGVTFITHDHKTRQDREIYRVNF